MGSTVPARLLVASTERTVWVATRSWTVWFSAASLAEVQQDSSRHKTSSMSPTPRQVARAPLFRNSEPDRLRTQLLYLQFLIGHELKKLVVPSAHRVRLSGSTAVNSFYE